MTNLSRAAHEGSRTRASVEDAEDVVGIVRLLQVVDLGQSSRQIHEGVSRHAPRQAMVAAV